VGRRPSSARRLFAFHTWKAARVAATFIEFDAVTARIGEAAGAYASGERRSEYRDHRLQWMVKSGGIGAVLAGLRDNTIRFPWPDPAKRVLEQRQHRRSPCGVTQIMHDRASHGRMGRGDGLLACDKPDYHVEKVPRPSGEKTGPGKASGHARAGLDCCATGH
jgi:hypothetical protein